MQLKDLKKFIKKEDQRLRKYYGGYKDEEKRILARTVKLTEELGELCDEVLSYNLMLWFVIFVSFKIMTKKLIGAADCQHWYSLISLFF